VTRSHARSSPTRQGRCSGFEDSPLRIYLACWHPATLAEVIGIPTDEASEPLRAPANGDLPPLPWGPIVQGDPRAERLRRRDFVAAAERLGVDPAAQWGSMLYGPASDGLGRSPSPRSPRCTASIAAGATAPAVRGDPHIGARIMLPR
jgi:hypothetical protein